MLEVVATARASSSRRGGSTSNVGAGAGESKDGNVSEVGKREVAAV